MNTKAVPLNQTSTAERGLPYARQMTVLLSAKIILVQAIPRSIDITCLVYMRNCYPIKLTMWRHLQGTNRRCGQSCVSTPTSIYPRRHADYATRALKSTSTFVLARQLR